MEKPYNYSKESFSSLYLANNPYNQMVNINSVTETSFSTGSELSTRINAMPAVTISFNPGKDIALSSSLEEMEKLSKQILPDNVIKSAAGNTAAFQKAMRQFILLIFLSIFVIYIILGILFAILFCLS